MGTGDETGPKTVRIHQVDAFTDEPLTGNPAGVVPRAEGLTDAQMLSIAHEMALSETAFLFESDRADRRIRYFTPTREVDLCGHATIGSFTHLYETGVLDGDDTVTATLETNIGVLEIEIDSDGTVWMTQDAPTITEVEIDFGRLANALGIDRSALETMNEDLPLAVSSTGLPFLIVPVTYLSTLGDADPSVADVEAITDDVGAIGLYAFTFDTLDGESTLHGRAFVPAAGVDEDPVTGTASGAVGAYLERFGALDPFPDELRLEQGHFLDRPGVVRVRLDGGVRVGGRGVTVLDGQIVVPPDENDEILEV